MTLLRLCSRSVASVHGAEHQSQNTVREANDRRTDRRIDRDRHDDRRREGRTGAGRASRRDGSNRLHHERRRRRPHPELWITNADGSNTRLLVNSVFRRPRIRSGAHRAVCWPSKRLTATARSPPRPSFERSTPSTARPPTSPPCRSSRRGKCPTPTAFRSRQRAHEPRPRQTRR